MISVVKVTNLRPAFIGFTVNLSTNSIVELRIINQSRCERVTSIDLNSYIFLIFVVGRCHVESFNFMLKEGMNFAVKDLRPVEFEIPSTSK